MSTRLAEWLTTQMRERRLGRNQLAKATGVGAATVTRITRYGHTPSPEVLMALADYFGADRDTVLEVAGLVTLSDLPPDVPPEVRDLARRLYRLPPKQRSAVLRHIDATLKLVEETAE